MTTSVNWVPRREVPEDAFVGTTSSAILSMTWEQDGSLTVLFEDDLTETQIVDCKFIMGTKDNAEGALLADGFLGMVTNQTYTETGYADEVNTIPQLVALSGQVNSIWRLLLGPLADLTLP